ncbi:MAG: chemotaxis-specific protein-glutamate methyltransferase CheB [Polyangiaceae bacterium]|jgi:two-component system chemotaxis response regulator CheB
MAKVRVLVVDDSLTVRRRLCEILGRDPDIEVVGEAGDGKRAIELCGDLRPDVVTLDMMLPVMSGLAATEYVMAHFPTPILVVSASTNRGEVYKTYEALAAGAVDVLDKPRGDATDDAWERQFLATIKLIAKIRVITHPRARLTGRDPSAPVRRPSGAPERTVSLVAVGASTGGPSALVDLLRALPTEFSLPLVFVLHISAIFGPSFADWLDAQTTRRVAFARDGETIGSAAGRVVMAPPEQHLVIRNGVFRLTGDPERHSCRPSVDVLFESMARELGAAAAGCLLTGMGRDGATGLLQIRRAGGLTIAQDEATSVIYGMPREAANLDAAERILPLGEIAPAIAALDPRTRTREQGP